MEFNLDLKYNAFNSIFQGLVHLNNAIVSKDHNLYEERIKDWKVEFDHGDQTLFQRKGNSIRWTNDELYHLPPKYYEFKFTISYLIHGIELLLLDIIKRNNESDIYTNQAKTKTIKFWTALKKVNLINPKLITDNQKTSLGTAKELRNKIEHFEIKSNYDELYGITCQLVSILNGIFQMEYNLIITEFYSYDCWKDTYHDLFEYTIPSALLDLEDLGFCKNTNIIENKIGLEYCFFCNVKSYDNEKDLCLLCLNEMDEQIKNLL